MHLLTFLCLSAIVGAYKLSVAVSRAISSDIPKKETALRQFLFYLTGYAGSCIIWVENGLGEMYEKK